MALVVAVIHIGVAAHLMAGENDNNLKWPFRGISILNQRGNHHHVTGTITFSDGTIHLMYTVPGLLAVGKLRVGGVILPSLLTVI